MAKLCGDLDATSGTLGQHANRYAERPEKGELSLSPTWNWPGSRWWRIDFHAHSPESYDFKLGGDSDSDDWRSWVATAREAGIHAVAITDHNTAEGIYRIQQATSEVENAPVIFPGVELTSSDGRHLLLLVDPGSTQQHVEEILSRSGVPVDQRGKMDALAQLGVEQILDTFGSDALVIGAHVNGPDGLLGLEGLQRIRVLKNQGLAAVEVNPGKAVDSSWLDGSLSEIGRSIPKVWASDSHRLDQLGQRFTWVKMTKPNLEGLRLALLDGPASLKPAAKDAPFNPNRYADLAIESITVHQAKFMGRPSPITVRLNPWMNAIVGGRGTGKSTLLDFCRKTLRRESELDGKDGEEEGSLRDFFERRLSVPASRSGAGLLTKDTLLETVYRKDGQRFTLSWSQDGEADPIARLDGDERTPQEGDIRERFPVRLYSQKQLFSLAQDPNALLTVIDDSQAVRGKELMRSVDQMATRYLSLRAQARAARNQANDLPAKRAAFEDIQHKLEILQKGGHAQIFNEYRSRRQINDTWQTILGGASEAVESVRRNAEELCVPDLDLGIGTSDDMARASLRSAHEALSRTVADLRGQVLQGAEKTKQEIEGIRTGAESSLWREGLDKSESQFREASIRLATEGISNPDEYDQLLAQASALRLSTASLESEIKRARELETEADKTLTEYREQREELSAKRRRFVRETSSDVIRVEIDKFGAVANLADELRETLGIERFEDDRREIGQRIHPEPNLPWDWCRLDSEIANMRRFHSGKLDSWETRDRRFESALRKVPPERIDRLALYLPEDSVTVDFREHQDGGWRSLAQGSPGQQTAALLAFVLGYGSEPIILDQPEDDLDNTLIYELLVTRLRETKLRRQIIVVTHNPNIVVHGDAELVISLDTVGGRSKIVCQGGLQERRVRDEICRVMEGGREAFESRYRRIMPTEGSVT